MSYDKRFCPNCGSENVEPDDRHTNVLGDMLFDQNKWLCNECGYTGLMPSGETSEEIEFKDGAEPDSVDSSAGKAYLSFLIYIVIPATLLYMVYLLIF